MQKPSCLKTVIPSLSILWILTGCDLGSGVVFSGQRTAGDGMGEIRLNLTAPSGVEGFAFTILKDNVVVTQRYVPVSSLELPANLQPAGTDGKRFADAYFVLEPGTYRVQAMPMRSATEPSPGCQGGESTVEVQAERTNEVVLVTRCGGATGGVDVVVIVDSSPVITGLVFDPSKFISTCQKLTVTVQTAVEPPASVRWEEVQAPAQASRSFLPSGSTLTFLSRTAGTYQVKVTVCDQNQACSALQFPIHVILSEDKNENGIGDECESGRVVTLLLILGNPRIAEHPTKAIATALAGNSVAWVSPVAVPRVLVVRDDNHQGDFAEDPAYVQGLLLQEGYQADLVDEPADGLSLQAFASYDVVWFANPGQPVDDARTIEALGQFVAQGGGLVLQGDDMTRNAQLQPLTHLKYQDNGERYCDQPTDNNLGKNYAVTVERQAHPVIAGLEGLQFLYGDDIDTSTPLRKGEVVLAWATVSPKTYCLCSKKPVIVAYDPTH